jgi:cytoskeletal protein CcmA (bactofilin family)
MKNITKVFAWFVPAFLFAFLTVLPAKAVYFQSADILTIDKDKKIDEAAVLAGSSIVINANINGDLYCAGRDVVVNGNVKGDIACATQSLKVNGTVDGNIRAVAQTIDIAGIVTRNLTVASQSLTLEPKSQIKGDLFFGAQNVNLNGQMGRDLAGAGETMTISGSLLRNAIVTSTDLSIIETAKIGGNLDYYVEKNAVATIGAKNVKGTVTKHEIASQEKTVTKEQFTKTGAMAMTIAKVVGILSFALLGLVLIYFDRKKTESRINQIATQPLKSGLIGLVTLIVFPVAFFIVLMTVIGIPLAFVVLLVYIVAMITASLYSSMFYGKLIISKASMTLQMLLGVALLGLVSCLPIIGWIIGFISFCLGLGAITLSFLPEKAK